MTTIVAGLTPDDFIETLNRNLPPESEMTADLPTGDLITAIHANYDHMKTLVPAIATRTNITIGMTGKKYIEALNQNFQKIQTPCIYDRFDYDVPLNAGSEYNLITDIYHGPALLKLSNGTHLASCMRRGGPGFSRENFTVVIDANGNCSTPNLIGYDEISEGTYDSHGKASIIEKGGVVYLFHEAYRGVGATKNGPHNSDIIVKKSTDGGYTWTEITRILGYHAYLQTFIIGSDIYLIARSAATTGFNPFYFSLWKSSDNCETWTALASPYIGNSGTYIYKDIVKSDTAINLVIFDRITSGGGTFTTYPAVYNIKSTDGITYTNAGGTWSKNVVTGGAITRTEALANCLIGTYTSDTYSAHWHGSFLKDGKLYTLISYGPCGVPTNDPGTGMWKTEYESCKLYENTTEILDLSALVSGFSYEGYVAQFLSLYRNGNTFDILQTNDASGNYIKLHNYNTEGLISTEIIKSEVSDVHGQMIGAATYGATTRAERMMTFMKLIGSWFDIHSAYADMVILKSK